MFTRFSQITSQFHRKRVGMESSLSLAIQHIESKIKEGSNASAGVISVAGAFVEKLRGIKELLRDAEPRLGRNTSHEIRRLFAELRDIAHTAEDEVDTVVSKYSALRNCLGFGDRQALKKLRRLIASAEEVKLKLKQHFEGSNKGSLSPARSSQSPKGHLPDDDLVIGIDHEIMTVLDLLTRKSNDSHKTVDKLAIVGMGGSGKTTLARSIYNHKIIKKHFQFQAWVSISQVMDPDLLLPDILKQIRGQRSRFSLFSLSWKQDEEPENESNSVVSQINDLLYQKNCLLVLDDVWDLKSLYKFITLIQEDSTKTPRYTIIITSRQTPSKQWHIHQPKPLTDEICWELLRKAASKSSEPLNDDYRSLATEMLTKCQGLPLAIVALARLLRTKDTPHEWQRVLSKATGTDATTMYGPVNEILGLSYDQLPYYLKPCFLYLALFPEDSHISGGTLIRMWIAEGFIDANSEDTQEVGKKYQQLLAVWSLIIKQSAALLGSDGSTKLMYCCDLLSHDTILVITDEYIDNPLFSLQLKT